ncbi:MAG: YihY/virulence factor BrkB family protein [Ancalomicrobiaceae bacterium]|nr:YihY/virulence factor BrkB family protein [Ancalomicrobiaceae bacterium]
MRLAGQSHGTLSLALAISLAVAGWSTNVATEALFDGLNVMFSTTETRSFMRLSILSLALTFAGVGMVIVALTTLAVLPRLLAFLPVSQEVAAFAALVRWPLLLAGCLLAIVVLYRSGPDRPTPRTWPLLPGALAATILWASASALFSWYVSTVATYSAVYGSLATVVIVLTWLWLSAIIMLAGEELTAQIEKRWC